MRITASAAWLAMLATIPLAIPASAAAAAKDPVLGRWMTQDRAAIVRIERCGRSVCGIADRVLDPKAPVNDIKNPDAKLKRRAIIGSTILSGFHQEGGEWIGGEAYSPKVGRTFRRASVKVMRDGRLQVTGCVFFICRSLLWTRVG